MPGGTLSREKLPSSPVTVERFEPFITEVSADAKSFSKLGPLPSVAGSNPGALAGWSAINCTPANRAGWPVSAQKTRPVTCACCGGWLVDPGCCAMSVAVRKNRANEMDFTQTSRLEFSDGFRAAGRRAAGSQTV